MNIETKCNFYFFIPSNMADQYPLFTSITKAGDDLINNPMAIVIVLTVIIMLFSIIPVYASLFIIAITVSVAVGLLSNWVLRLPQFKKIGLSDIEEGVIGGVVAGTVGFIAGTYFGEKLQASVGWGYY